MSIFKDTFKTDIQDQLKARGKAALDRNIQYFNSRTAFVRLTSGVDVDVEGVGDNLARNYVLQGGILNSDNSLKIGVGDFTSAYSKYTYGVDGKMISNQRGIKPMPGITGISIKSLSAYGSMRSARVTFECHDIKQLEALELLYMRPGFTVLLEWGWAPYLDNDGVLQNNIQFYDDIFEKVKCKTFQERCNELFKKSSEQYKGNYDALLGYVKNYQWEAREDGGFSCWTEIMSIGEIMESLKINYTPNFIANVKKEGIIREKLNILPAPESKDAINTKPKIKSDSEITKPFYKDNIVAGIISELIAYGYACKEGTTDEGAAWTVEDKNGDITGIPGHIMHFYKITINNNNADGTAQQKAGEKSDGLDSDEQYYLDLESFVNIFNKNIIIAQNSACDPNKKEPLIKLSTKDREYAGLFDDNLYCLAHPLQISVDPMVCLIKNETFKNIEKLKIEVKPVDAIKSSSSDPKDAAAIAAKAVINGFMAAMSLPDNEGIQLSLINNYVTKYYNESTMKWGSLMVHLCNAYEDWKQKNFIGQKVRDLSWFTKIFSGKEAENEVRQEQVDEFLAKDFGEILIDEWNNFGDYTLINFLNNALNQGYIKAPSKDTAFPSTESYNTFVRKYFKPNPEFKAITDESVKEQNAALSTGEEIEDLDINLSFLKKLTKPYFVPVLDNSGVLGTIGGIYINLVYALGLATSEDLKNQDPKEKREINLYDYFKTLLNEIQGSLGSLNNFDIHVDPIDSVARIIDINVVTDKKPEDIYNTAFTFLSDNPNEPDSRLNGLFNNIRNYKWASSITKDLSTIVAISAQNGGGQLGIDNETLVGFNVGITDRIKPDVGPPLGPSYVKGNASNLSVLLEGLKNSILDISTFFEELNAYGIFTDRDYDSASSSKYKDALRDLLNTLKAISKTNSKFKAIIPTKLSLEIDGIGGLIIGNIFRMPNELLPAGYKQSNPIGVGRKLGYIVTGIGHEIKDNDWTTNIECQTSILESGEEGVDVFGDINQILLEGKEATVTITPGSSNITVAPKPGPSAAPPRALTDAMRRYGITGTIEKAHFLSQCAHESGNFSVTQENLNYSEDSLKATFGKYFPGDLAKSYARQPAKIANRVYANRLGNGPETSGDGWKYRGRGYIQLTGKSNYISYNNHLKQTGKTVDVVTNPDLLATQEYAADSACYWWKYIGRANSIAKGVTAADVKLVTQRVNGGQNGLTDRQNKFNSYYSTLQQNPNAF